MREIFFKIGVLIFLMPLFMSFSSCNSQTDNRYDIYNKGKKWEYNCKFYSSNQQVTDSFIMTMEVKSNFAAFISQQIPIVYEYPDENGEMIKDGTGVVVDESYISIHQPRIGKLTFASILPMPSIHLPLESENVVESYTETKITKSPFKELEGKTVKYKITSIGTDSLSFKDDMIKCYIYEAKQLNMIEEVGEYSMHYWFNEDYGFVRYLFFKPDESWVDIKLRDIINN